MVASTEAQAILNKQLRGDGGGTASASTPSSQDNELIGNHVNIAIKFDYFILAIYICDVIISCVLLLYVPLTDIRRRVSLIPIH